MLPLRRNNWVSVKNVGNLTGSLTWFVSKSLFLNYVQLNYEIIFKNFAPGSLRPSSLLPLMTSINHPLFAASATDRARPKFRSGALEHASAQNHLRVFHVGISVRRRRTSWVLGRRDRGRNAAAAVGSLAVLSRSPSPPHRTAAPHRVAASTTRPADTISLTNVRRGNRHRVRR